MRFWRFVIFFCLTLTVGRSQTATVEIFNIEGAHKTRVSFLKNILKAHTGMGVDSLLFENDIRKLHQLAGIAEASFTLKKMSEFGYTLTYHLKERFTVIPQLNIWSADGIFSLRTGVYDFNFMGRDMMVGGFYQYNGFNSYGLSFRAPYLFSRKLGMAFNHQNWSSREPVFFAEGSADYKYSNTSFEVLGVYEFNFRNRIDLGVNVFKETYNFLGGFREEGIPENLDLNKLLFKSVYTFDAFSYDYQYVNGFKNNLYIQYVITRNNFQNDFFIFWNDFFYFKRLGSKGNWANRLRFGVSSNEETPFAPFSVDNNVNIRGVGFIIDRGTASLVWNTEYRHTLIDTSWFVLQGNVFADLGTWRNPGGDFGDFTDPDNYRIYPGLGLRFMHKKVFNAIFRIDYGYGISKNANQGIVFGIGQYF